MTFAPKKMLRATAAAAGLALAVQFGTAGAAAETLLFNNFVPQGSIYYTHGIETFKKAVEEATDGDLTIDITPSTLAPADAQPEMLQTGVADIAIFATSWHAEQFVLSDISALPFSGESSEAASVATWRTHEAYFADAPPIPGVKMLSYFRLTPKTLFTVGKEIKSPADIDGLKVQTITANGAAIVEALNGIAVERPQVHSYEMLNSGVVDATYTEFPSLFGFKSSELVNHVYEMPQTGVASIVAIGMNEDRFNSLSPEHQEAILAASGETWARTIGGEWDRRMPVLRDKLVEAGATLNRASDDMLDPIKPTLDGFTARWMEAASGLGIDAQAARAYYLEQFAEADAE